MKKYIYFLIVTLVVALPLGANADLFGFITGTVQTIGNFINGETTVTPAYALNTWDEYTKYMDDLYDQESDRFTVRYDRIGHQYFYSHSHTDTFTGYCQPIVFLRFLTYSLQTIIARKSFTQAWIIIRF